MITTVAWRYVILDKDRFNGHRVKRVSVSPGGMTVPQSGTDHPSTNPANPDVWTKNAPPHITLAGPPAVGYNFAFWSITGRDRTDATRREASVWSGRTADFTKTGGEWELQATAWYVWDFDSGGGPHGIFVDAFNIEMGDFMSEDFIDVAPDDAARSRTHAANDGVLWTAAPFEDSTITAREDPRPGTMFSEWQVVESLTSPPVNGPTISGREIRAHENDRMVAFAFYHGPWYYVPPIVKARAPIVILQPGGDTGPVPGSIDDPRPGPGDPWGYLVSASRLWRDSRLLSGRGRTDLLKTAERLARDAADALKKEMRAKEGRRG